MSWGGGGVGVESWGHEFPTARPVLAHTPPSLLCSHPGRVMGALSPAWPSAPRLALIVDGKGGGRMLFPKGGHHWIRKFISPSAQKRS